MSAKYTSLLEACDKVQLTGKLGILEESSLDEAAIILRSSFSGFWVG